MKNTFWVVSEWPHSAVIDGRHVRIEVRGYISEGTFDHIVDSRGLKWQMPKEISRHHNYAEARAMQKLIRAARGVR